MITLLLVVLIQAAPATASSAVSMSTRAGPRALMPAADEIRLARSAAPTSVSGQARVLVLTDTGYVVAVEGTNGVTCVVSRSWRHSREPHCYDGEGAATELPMELRRTVLRHRGVNEADVARDIADGLLRGAYHLPRRPAVTYMMSACQELYDDDGRRAGAWHPHMMIYFPYLKGSDVGLGSTPDMTAGMVADEGTAESVLVLVMPQFTPAACRGD